MAFRWLESSVVPFDDREDAGRQLAERLDHLRDRDPIVLGMPRGGVVVAAAIARSLDAPLDVLVVRKIASPDRPELALGAVANGDRPRRVLNDEIIAALGLTTEFVEAVSEDQLNEVRRRRRLYCGDHPPPPLTDRTVILVDDGIATGATVKAGLGVLRQAAPAHLVLAVPVGPHETVEALRKEVDELVCLRSPPLFGAVGVFYRDFGQVSDAAVVEILGEGTKAQRHRGTEGSDSNASVP